MTRIEIQRALELKSRENFERRCLKPALAEGMLEMTLPDKPNSRLQKYRLTQAGKKLLEEKNVSTPPEINEAGRRC